VLGAVVVFPTIVVVVYAPKKVKMFCFQCNFDKFKFIFEKIRQIFSLKNLKTKTGCVGI
jgi:hypothetical protein